MLLAHLPAAAAAAVSSHADSPSRLFGGGRYRCTEPLYLFLVERNTFQFHFPKKDRPVHRSRNTESTRLIVHFEIIELKPGSIRHPSGRNQRGKQKKQKELEGLQCPAPIDVWPPSVGISANRNSQTTRMP